MTQSFTDLKLEKKPRFYDISFDDLGRLEVNNDFITSFLVSFFTDRRADASENADELKRRGWWGDLYKQENNLPVLGSKIWLLSQTRSSDEALNFGKSYLSTAFKWLTKNRYATRIEVSGVINFESFLYNIKVYRDNSLLNEIQIELWENTTAEIRVT